MDTGLRRNWRPIVLLMVLAPVIAEILGGAMPVADFVQPGILIPFTVFLYGLPVLVIREVAARLRFGLPALWVLGMVYGLFNEGLLSETLYAGLDHAIAAHADYGVVAGIRVPWLLYILPWHGLFSVVTPIVLVDGLFPARAGRPLLPKAAAWCIAVGVGGLAVARFLLWGENREVQDTGLFAAHLTLVVAAAAALCLIAVRVAAVLRVEDGAEPRGSRWTAFATGAALYLLAFIGLSLLVEAAAPPLVTVAYFALVVACGLRAVTRRPHLARAEGTAFVLGSGSAYAGFAVVAGSLLGDVVWAATGACFLAAYLTAATRIARSR
ncbi:hypothetical protein [Murinocardiopsis flavida]|nr:hypothetical protein [Murinocardiopsis flavida]